MGHELEPEALHVSRSEALTTTHTEPCTERSHIRGEETRVVPANDPVEVAAISTDSATVAKPNTATKSRSMSGQIIKGE